MPVDSLKAGSALVLIDLQRGITALPTVHPADEVVERAARLAGAFRDHELPVVLVNVAFSPDGGDVLRARVDAQPPAVTQSADFAELRPELAQAPGDLRITKRGWDAFFGTELDLQLRRRGIEGIVLAGISTSIGVEATARSAHAHGYEVVVAADAVTDMSESAHRNSIETIMPRLARLGDTEAIIAAL
ncbi:MAG TPA: hydrolase [Solirubrobacteraceae bacterium]|jgi:nicotinamidase-related amidase